MRPLPLGMNGFSFCRGCQGSVPETIKVRMPLNEFDLDGIIKAKLMLHSL